MVVHKKVAKAVKKVGKKVVRKALRRVGIRVKKTTRTSDISKFFGSRVAPATKAAKRSRKIRPAVENPRFRKRRNARGPRGGKGPRKIVGPSESQAIGRSPRRRTGRRLA